MKILLKIFTIVIFAFLPLYASNETAEQIGDRLSKSYLDYDSVWFSSLKSYRTYERLSNKAMDLQKSLENAKRDEDSQSISRFSEELAVVKNNLQLYNYNTKPPFFELSTELENTLKSFENAKITFSSIFSSELDKSVKKSKNLLGLYEKEYLDSISYINDLLIQINNLEENSINIQSFIRLLNNDKELFATALDTLNLTYEQILKQQTIHYENVEYYKDAQLQKILYVAGSILIVYFIFLLFKLLFFYRKKSELTEENDQKYFTVKKLLNILFVIIASLILAFSYIDNVTQALAIFGVIGAGLTIVMKEWVLSFVGWMTLMLTSSIKLGDRIRIDKDRKPIIGDVIDISLTKITLYENITNDALTAHKRAGRIIFIPNYFLITNEVYNYTHHSLKTILDTVEFNVSFDSNLEKAEKIVLEVALNTTSRYTDMAKRQYNALKNRYTLRNMPNYPRVFFYPHSRGDGITIGLWYVTPYREILGLKSEMTKEVSKRLQEQKDIHLLYSATTTYVEKLPGTSLE